MSQDPSFTEAQKQYLEGFIAGIAKRHGIAVPNGPAALAPAEAPGGSDPTALHIAAQDRAVAAGGKLVPEELAKRKKNPFDMWDEMAANAAAGRFPKGLDVFRHKFHGLFYAAPNQDAFMLRLRLPGGIVSSYQARGLADVAERFGGGTIDVTTRANLQIREIGAGDPIEVLTAIDELGLTSRGAGADNIRNLTGSPTAGIDPQELIDTRPLTRALYHHILNHRELYGLPRKFNISFDGGGGIAMLEDTADIGFAAVRVGREKPIAEGVYFRMLLGGLTGQGSFGRDAGVLLEPHEVVAAAAAILRVFVDHGDRTDRRRARRRDWTLFFVGFRSWRKRARWAWHKLHAAPSAIRIVVIAATVLAVFSATNYLGTPGQKSGSRRGGRARARSACRIPIGMQIHQE
jgi:ferredoxin-nitrite reductase